MKKSILCVLAVLISVEAFAIDDASSVFKSVICKTVQSKALPPNAEYDSATIYISGSRPSPKAPFVLSYQEELWAQTGKGPLHRIFDYPNLICNTGWYRTGSTTYGAPHFELNCHGTSSEGNAFVLINIDPRVNPRTGVAYGVGGQGELYPLQCTYERF